MVTILVKRRFSLKFREFFPREMKKIILREVRFNLHTMRLNIRKLKKLVDFVIFNILYLLFSAICLTF